MLSQTGASTRSSDAASPATRFFRNSGVATAFGIILPLMCIRYDPIVFSANFFPTGPILGSYKIVGYGSIGLSMIALTFWLPLRRFPSVFCGFLAAGCLFASVLGIVLLPISLLGLMLIIGILGFLPFITATTFWHCAAHARELAGNQFKPALAVAAFLLFLAIPLTTQACVWHITEQSLTILVHGPEKSTEQAVSRLKMLGRLIDSDLLVTRYGETRSENGRKRIANAYTELTDGDIEDRLERLLD